MAHYAFIDENNIVTEVIAGRDEDDLIEGVTSWEDYYGAFRNQRCLRTSFNTRGGQHFQEGVPFRGNYAGIGFEYREDLDAFIPTQPFPSWLLNEQTFNWDSPIAMPEAGVWDWDEEAGNWSEVTGE